MSKASEEAQKQLDRIVALGYPDVADMSPPRFRALARPLIRALEDSDLGTQILWCLRASWFPGIVDRAYVDQPYGWFHHDAAARYRQFSSAGWFRTSGRSVLLGGRAAYGNVLHQSRADVARKLIDSDERLPLTLEEGLAIATQHPEWLLEKNGFNLLGSRSADGRVPSIWMSQNAPRLGAVWPNSRHTWLGNAFCVSRRGVSLFH